MLLQFSKIGSLSLPNLLLKLTEKSGLFQPDRFAFDNNTLLALALTYKHHNFSAEDREVSLATPADVGFDQKAVYEIEDFYWAAKKKGLEVFDPHLAALVCLVYPDIAHKRRMSIASRLPIPRVARSIPNDNRLLLEELSYHYELSQFGSFRWLKIKSSRSGVNIRQEFLFHRTLAK